MNISSACKNTRKKHGNVAVFIPHAGCPHTCSFCNQRAISGKITSVTVNEIKSACEIGLESIKAGRYSDLEFAFFGGSFTAIPFDEMVSYLEMVQPYIKSGYFSGIRISTRPDYINEKILKTLKSYHVTAIELGAQSMDNKVLSLNLRGHSADDVITSSKMIKSFGFELGLQMMTGLYSSTPEIDRQTAIQLAKLAPASVRIYPTVVMKETHLEKLYLDGQYLPPSLEENISLCAWLLDFFEIEHKIKVIKLGLHSSQALKDGEVVINSSYHPAFRELCESRLLRDKLENMLTPSVKASLLNVAVRQDMISSMIGQKKENILYFNKLGYNLKVKQINLCGNFGLEEKYRIDIIKI